MTDGILRHPFVSGKVEGGEWKGGDSPLCYFSQEANGPTSSLLWFLHGALPCLLHRSCVVDTVLVLGVWQDVVRLRVSMVVDSPQ